MGEAGTNGASERLLPEGKTVKKPGVDPAKI